MAFVTTWIGFEVGQIATGMQQMDGYNEAAYTVFLKSIPYSFYPILAMFFVFLVSLSGRDFGPMYHAEIRARTTGQVLSSTARVDESAGGARELVPNQLAGPLLLRRVPSQHGLRLRAALRLQTACYPPTPPSVYTCRHWCSFQRLWRPKSGEAPLQPFPAASSPCGFISVKKKGLAPKSSHQPT